MHTLINKKRKSISTFLVLTMIASLWLAVPMPAKAGLLGTIGSIAKKVVVIGGSLAAGAGGAVLGMALGGGPIGMVVGGVAGYIIGKKVLGWATSSFANAGTVLGAVAGGVLLAGAGIPLLAAGIIGGAVLGRFAGKLISKITGKAVNMVQVKGVNKEMDKKSMDFINGMAKRSPMTTTASVAPAVVQSVTPAAANSQDAYSRYLTAYRSYMDATQKGNSVAAKKAFSEYQTALAQYQANLK